MHDLRSVEQQVVAARRPRPDWLAILIASMLALGALSAGALALDLGRTYGGFMAFYSFGDERWRVDFATPIWWPALADMCLHPGDVVESINGEPTGLIVPTAFRTGSADGRAMVTVRHAGRQFTCELTLKPFPLADYVDLKLPEIIIGLGFWLLSVVIYRSRPAEPLNRVFASAATVIAGYQWLGHASLFPWQCRRRPQSTGVGSVRVSDGCPLSALRDAFPRAGCSPRRTARTAPGLWAGCPAGDSVHVFHSVVRADRAWIAGDQPD